MADLINLQGIRESIYNEVKEIVFSKVAREKWTNFAMKQYLRIITETEFDKDNIKGKEILTKIILCTNNTVCKEYGRTNLGVRSKKTEYVMARHMLHYLSNHFLNVIDCPNEISERVAVFLNQQKKYSTAISRHTGLSHSSVIYGIKTMQDLCDTDKELRNTMENLKSTLEPKLLLILQEAEASKT